MAVLSRPSLRSVRREEPTDAPKKQRMERSDRRKSSPDCLDTTVEEPKTRLNLKTQSRSRTRRRASSSSVDVASPAGQLATPATRTNGTGTGTKTARARRNPATPSGKNLFGIHESPDPLDTISPAPSGAQKQRTVTPSITDDVKPLVSPVPRTSRRIDNRVEGKVEGMLNATVTPAPAADHKDADEQTEEKRSGRRSLRSTDTGSRCKSELAQYFHNYEQIISLEEAEPEFLAAKTTLTLIDDLSKPLPIPKPDPTPFGNPLLNLHGCTKLSLPSKAPSTTTDPLNEGTYFRAHRKFERQEKQLRNIERNRAQHEQQVLERLLDELRGHDWLRVMGLPNIQDPEKKLYEPKREILIQELISLVNKFQAWKDEERRRKLEKEKEKPDDADPSRKRRLDDDSSPAPGDLQTPDPNDVDALAARQLHQEARSAGAKSKKRKSTKTIQVEEELKSPKGKKLNSTVPPAPTKNLKQASLSLFWAPAREGPFTSFFRQRHVRDAAIAATKGIRRGGSRSALAFGQPVPEVDEVEFEVPGEILTEEAILQSRRKRRRLKRRSLG